MTRALATARWLVIGVAVALLFSPPLTNILQAALLVLVLSSRELRSRGWDACRQPMVIAALAFYLALCAGMLYSIATPRELGAIWVSWRKLLLLPLAAAIFDDGRSKLMLVHVLLIVAVLAVLASFFGVATGLTYPVPERTAGIVVRNHATQGMIFAAAAFAAAVLALMGGAAAAGRRWWLGGAAILLAVNVVLFTPGRSGYLVLLVCAGALVLAWFSARNANPARSWLVAGATVSVLVAVLATAPASRDRIRLAVDEMQNFEHAKEFTSMGGRMYFWKNTLVMIGRQPWFGTGTASFEEAYRREVAGRAGVAGKVTSDPHNQFMKVAAEQGLVGLAVFVAFLATALAQRPARLFRVLGLGVLAAWCATSLANAHFSTFSEGTFIFIWLGAMLANEKAQL